MFKVFSVILAHWYDFWNTIVIAINFCNGKKMICTLMFIISNHGIKCLSKLLQLEPYNNMFNVISVKMPHWYDLWKTIFIANSICTEKKIIHALMFIISSHCGIKCLNILLQSEPCNVMFKGISDIMVHWYDLWNKIVIAINFCYRKKMICALMFIISNHYGTKCLRNVLQFEPCYIMFIVMSDIMANWHDLWNRIVIVINFCNANKWFRYGCLLSAIWNRMS